MAKLTDVAKLAGVSVSTVSNVFNNPEMVRPKLRRRVEAAAAELGYAGPDPKARFLRAGDAGKANAIGLLANSRLAVLISDPYGRAFIGGAAEVCDEKEASLVLLTSFSGGGAVRAVKGALVDGFILHHRRGEAVAVAKSRRLPVVTVDEVPQPDASSVTVENRSGAREAARHLVRLGHRRFAILMGDTASDWEMGSTLILHPPGRDDPMLEKTLRYYDMRQRLAGFAEALHEAGIAIGDVPVVRAVYPPNDIAAAQFLLDNAGGATAVITAADRLALGVIREARGRGIRIPDDMSVIGFDGVPEGAHSEPPLTTVFTPIWEKGRAAARLVLDPPAVPRHEIVPTHLLVRASTGPAPRSKRRGRR